MTMAMRWCLLYGRLRMNLHHCVNLRMRMRMLMCMRVVMSVAVRVVIRMVVGHGIVMVVSAHAIFDTKRAVFAAVARHERLGSAALQVVDPFFQQLKDLALKAEVSRRYETNRRVLRFEVCHLAVDALDQRAVEQVVRQHHHLRHA